jgi:hypothetical protein
MPNDIYLSSTLDDLQVERSAAREVLGKQGFGIKESYQASEQELITSCLEDVTKCAMYVCLVGMRYGYRPQNPVTNPDDKSITRLEFEQAKRLNLPCFVFVKSDTARNYRPGDMDSHTGENGGGARVRAFREWIDADAKVRASRFETVEQLREMLLAAVLNYRREKEGDSSLLKTDDRHLAELSTDVGLVIHPGADPTVTADYLSQLDGDNRFKRILLAPDEPEYLARLDESARACRAVCWLLTPDGIQSYKDNPGVLARAIDVQQFRRGAAGVLLAAGAGLAALSSDWHFSVSIEADGSAPVVLNDLYVAMRARVPAIRPDRRIGVPCLVLAMTTGEADALVAAPTPIFAAINDPAERALRTGQLQQTIAAIRQPGRFAAWPQQAYGDCREDWRPFGPAMATAREYLTRAVDRINDGEPSKRERLLMKRGDRRLHLLWYSIDELLNDVRSSGAALQAVRDRGCIVLVDEMSLLHPALRAAAKSLLKGENLAVLSAQPVDPAPLPVSAMLGNDSVLQVGSLMSRFRDQQDPRCEVAINSPQRLERWLRLVLPELVPMLGGVEVQTELANRSDEELFGKKVPT